MSAEKEARVGTAEHVVRNKIKPVLDEALAELSLEFDLERWSYISIIMPKDFVSDYPEVARLHKKTKVLEFRLHIPFDDFLSASEYDQISMMLNAIERSIDMMGKFKVSEKDRKTLRQAVNETRNKLLKTLGDPEGE
ncbi:Imm44 family immunity protein [Pseudomonas lundensis]|uniref:Imm44 family immunity protein n=1 Tax=Pseudomonas lundensis TaxID=86185 RepID=UPI000641C7A5|nr:Imm44 family immunity protein [Pseudomonas lundensis]